MTQQPEFTPRRGSVSSHYEPSREADSTLSSADVSLAPSFTRWRLYLLAHLGMVVFMAAMYVVGNAALGADSFLLRSPAMRAIGPALNVFAMLLMLHNFYVSPILVVVLFVKGWRRDGRYAVAGIVELLLTGAFFFVCLPMVQ